MCVCLRILVLPPDQRVTVSLLPQIRCRRLTWCEVPAATTQGTLREEAAQL